MPKSTLTVKYQATIPKVVRETLVLAAGDRVEFVIEAAGEVRLRKAAPESPELRELEATLAPEWDSPEDEVAYGRL